MPKTPKPKNLNPEIKDDKKSNNLSQREFAAILISIFFLVITCTVLYFPHDEMLNAIGFILLGFFLGMLSFLIIGTIEGNKVKLFGINISQISGGFLVFAIVLASLFSYKRLTNEKMISSIKAADKIKIDSLEKQLHNFNTEAIKIDDPRRKEIWEKGGGTFEWFNAPLKLATEEHAKTKFAWFKDPDFKLQLVLIYSDKEDLNNTYFLPRFENLKEFVRNMKKQADASTEKIDLQNQLIVKVVKSDFIPTQSFFTTTQSSEGKPYSIFYLPTKDNIMKPSDCIVSSSAEFNKSLHTEFEKYWDSGKKLSITKLLDESLKENNDVTAFF